MKMVCFSGEIDPDVKSFEKTLVEKVKLIEELDEKQKSSLFTFIDLALTNKRLKESLRNTLELVG
jgi:hypothetical protein